MGIDNAYGPRGPRGLTFFNQDLLMFQNNPIFLQLDYLNPIKF